MSKFSADIGSHVMALAIEEVTEGDRLRFRPDTTLALGLNDIEEAMRECGNPRPRRKIIDSRQPLTSAERELVGRLNRAADAFTRLIDSHDAPVSERRREFLETMRRRIRWMAEELERECQRVESGGGTQ